MTAGTSPPDKSPLEKLLDLAVYAPLGALLIAKDQLPGLVERGRHYLGTEINAPGVAGPGPRARAVDDDPRRDSRFDASGGDGRTAAGADMSSAHLAIPGYDSLSASQVVQRLAGLTPDELVAVGAYESATRGRRTILTKIEQLQSGA